MSFVGETSNLKTAPKGPHIFAQTRSALDSISPSFCLAKWKQVTLHLQTGQTHSCHHPGTHKIPGDLVQREPGTLHNTPYKIQQRESMLNGIKPEECSYCWRIEDANPEFISDRIIKSSDPWAMRDFDEIISKPLSKTMAPSYLEVSFSNACNFKCSYCMPNISSKWYSEVMNFGPFPTKTGYNGLDYLLRTDKIPMAEDETNVYLTAFWKWLPEIYLKLDQLRVTGGEPLLSQGLPRLIKFISENPNPHLQFSVNSNLGSSAKIIQNFLKQVENVKLKSKVKTFNLYTSIDTWGPQAEYIRDGLNLNLFEKNFESAMECEAIDQITIMVTFNVLSPFRFLDLLEKVMSWKRRAAESKKTPKIYLDVSYLIHPEFMGLHLLPQEYHHLLFTIESFVKKHLITSSSEVGFSLQEYSKLTRLTTLFDTKLEAPKILEQQKDLALFAREHDRRRGTNFNSTFPELEDYFNYWLSMTDEDIQSELLFTDAHKI